MPAGMSYPKYLTLIVSNFGFMFLGAQFVHNIYRPLDDLEEFIEKYKEQHPKLLKVEYDLRKT